MIVQGPDGKRIQFPDGTPLEAIKAAMAKQYGGPTQIPPVSPITEQLSLPPRGATPSRLGEFLPTAGGFIGGMAGNLAGPLRRPASIAGAGLGGALGEGAREFLGGEPISGLGIGKRAAEQAAYEAAGGLIGGAAGRLARPIMRRALGVGKAISGEVKIGGKLFPDPVGTALERRIQVTPKGAVKVGTLRMESGAALKELLKQEAASGRKFSTIQVARHVDTLLRSKVLPAEAKEKILKDVTAFYREKGRRISPTLLQKVKQYYQRQARGIYRAGEEGAFTLADQPHGQFAQALARGAREQLERIPGVAARNIETRRLMGAEKAVRTVVQKPSPAFELFRPGTYPMVSRLMGQDVLSKTALLLTDRRFQVLARQSPRLAAAIMMQLSQSDEPDVTSIQP